MNLPPGAVFAYSFEPEARYWPTVTASNPDQVPDITVMASHLGGGRHWEFLIEDPGTGELRLSRHSDPEDLEAARAQVPEFFAAMAELRPRTLEEVRAVLARLGAVDVTLRERY
jgi:hypothetical protein